jgi:hypothetical protein
LLSQESLEVFYGKTLEFLLGQKFELGEKGQQERALTTGQVGPSLNAFANSLMIKQLIVRYDGHLPARPLIRFGMTFLPDAQITFNAQKILAVEVKILREQDASGSLSKAIGQTLMYRRLGFECSIGLIFDLRKGKKDDSLGEALLNLSNLRRTDFILFR